MARRPRLSWRENYLRTVEFRGPEYIPCRIVIAWPLWNTYRDRLKELALKYPMAFYNFKPEDIEYDEKPGILRTERVIKDPFGCTWIFNIRGYQGQVVKHPLEDWRSFKEFKLPDPEEGIVHEGAEEPVPWSKVFEELDKARTRGDLVVAHMPHGFFFQRLYYLRGFTNLLKDFIQKPPQIYELIEALTEYNLKLVKILLKSGRIDVIAFGDDLGAQDRMPISPETFREFIFPSYRKIFQSVRSRSVNVRLHTDGHVTEVIDQLMEAGVNILNIQDKVNGLDNIVTLCKGKVCVDLDIDRQHLIPFGTPKQIRDYIKYVVETLAMKEGGLMLTASVYPPAPLENIKAIAEAMEEYMWLQE